MQKLGILLFIIALGIFTASLSLESYQLSEESIYSDSDFHKTALLQTIQAANLLDKEYTSNIAFIKEYKTILKNTTTLQENNFKAGKAPKDAPEWDYKLGNWKYSDYLLKTTKAASIGIVSSNKLLFLLLTFGLGILGGILFIIPAFQTVEGIKNNGIYHNVMTRGLTLSSRSIFLGFTIIGVLLYGIVYMGNFLWPLLSLGVIGLITFLVFYIQKSKDNSPTRSASPSITAWLGVFTGIYLIGFYILLYWKPEYMTSWMLIADPVSLQLSGNGASQWFLYGLLYTAVMWVMGVRMIAKYRHNRYQLIRTGSVIFFQTAFAFLIPEILIRLNQPYFDFKNIWPLDYDFFFNWNIEKLISSGGLGIFMLVWGIVLALIGVPIITYFFGKRWYCSWVCGCGGLAETLGDPYRQLSDKSLRAWKFERWIIHGVLVAAVLMTILTLTTYFTGKSQVLFFNSDTIRTWYGFLIGSAFAGIVGTGFYPIMGNRVWCRFGCPLAAYLGLIQRFKSRFRITTNGGQCISCGNCSTYCEMGIDVRAYAQKGQNIVRASCVGCGVCAAVCPRGVLRLENGSADIGDRTTELKALHIGEGGISLM